MDVLTGQTPLVVKLLVFAIAVLPLLIDNLRTSRATNLNNLILGAAGIVMVGAEHALGWSQQSLWAIAAWTVFGVIGLTGLGALSGAPGGAIKTLMALLPWFPSLDFFIVVTAGFLLTALIGFTIRRDAPIAPPFVVASIGVWCAGHPAPGVAIASAVLLCGWLVSRVRGPGAEGGMARVRTRAGGDVQGIESAPEDMR